MRTGEVQHEIADGHADARRDAAAFRATNAERQILHRKIAAGTIGGFDPALYGRIVRFVERAGHVKGIVARSSRLESLVESLPALEVLLVELRGL